MYSNYVIRNLIFSKKQDPALIQGIASTLSYICLLYCTDIDEIRLTPQLSNSRCHRASAVVFDEIEFDKSYHPGCDALKITEHVSRVV